MVNTLIKEVILKYANQYEYKRIYKFQKIYFQIRGFALLYWYGNLKLYQIQINI